VRAARGDADAIEPQAFDLFVYLVQHLEHVVTKDELLRAV
jgi:DNA-binding winged helix-turn-helix (wHTH) protein